MADYSFLNQQLTRLLSLLNDVLSNSEISEVQEFIDVDEYGLAFHTLLDIIDEESKSITERAFELAKHIAITMEFDGKAVEKKLKPHLKKANSQFK